MIFCIHLKQVSILDQFDGIAKLSYPYQHFGINQRLQFEKEWVLSLLYATG